MAQASGIPDEVWRQLTRPRGPTARWLPVIAVVLAVALAGVGLRLAGLTGPRLAAEPITVRVLNPAGPFVELTVRLRNLGLSLADPTTVMDRHGVHAEPQDLPDEFPLRAGETRDVTIRVRIDCSAGPDLLSGLRMVAYGPIGGTEVEVRLADPPASTVRGLAGDHDWRAALSRLVCA